MENFEDENLRNCESESVSQWAAWFEGEESWGDDSGNDDDVTPTIGMY